MNADESEPGTFKDRELMEFNPHQVIEGAAIAAYAVGATRVYHYLRGEFKPVARKMQAAIDEAYAAGYLGQNVFGSSVEIQMFLHLGAGAYICGEESEEGRRSGWMIERTSCLGLCDRVPTAFVEGEQAGPLAPEDFSKVTSGWRGSTTDYSHPLPGEVRVMMSDAGQVDPDSLSSALEHGAYAGLKKALSLPPEQVVVEVENSGLTGRGGAGFPAGRKWRFVAQAGRKPSYIICNADESEPLIFKDRVLIDTNPHQILEGIAIAGYATKQVMGADDNKTSGGNRAWTVSEHELAATVQGWLQGGDPVSEAASEILPFLLRSREDTIEAESRLIRHLAAATQASDGLLARLVDRPLSRLISPPLARRRIPPNAITLVSMSIGLCIGAWLLAQVGYGLHLLGALRS